MPDEASDLRSNKNNFKLTQAMRVLGIPSQNQTDIVKIISLR